MILMCVIISFSICCIMLCFHFDCTNSWQSETLDIKCSCMVRGGYPVTMCTCFVRSPAYMTPNPCKKYNYHRTQCILKPNNTIDQINTMYKIICNCISGSQRSHREVREYMCPTFDNNIVYKCPLLPWQPTAWCIT